MALQGAGLATALRRGSPLPSALVDDVTVAPRWSQLRRVRLAVQELKAEEEARTPA